MSKAFSAARGWGVWALLMVVLLAGCSSEAERTSEFDRADSPQGTHRLLALIIEPRFPQGPHEVALEVEDLASHTRRRLLQTELAWDGVPFTRRNIALRWTTPRSAVMCLSATDRPDKAVRVTVGEDGEVRVEMREGC